MKTTETDRCFFKLESEGPHDYKSVAEMRWHFARLEEIIKRDAPTLPSTPDQPSEPQPSGLCDKTHVENIAQSSAEQSRALSQEEPEHEFRPSTPYVSAAIWLDAVWEFCKENPVSRGYYSPEELATALHLATGSLLQSHLRKQAPEIRKLHQAVPAYVSKILNDQPYSPPEFNDLPDDKNNISQKQENQEKTGRQEK